MLFPDQNSTDFPSSLKTNLDALKHTKKEYLRYHQFLVYNYLIGNHNARGVLLFHEMGFGKSITAVSIAEYYRTHDPDRRIVILLSKSLQKNFKNSVVKYINATEKNVDSKTADSAVDDYQFVSLNASNMFSQISQLDKSDEELAFENTLKEFTTEMAKGNFLENSILIIDEFHNFSNAITNGSTNAIRLYDAIMQTKDIKLLFMSGTPIINRPFETAAIFNMIRGPVYLDGLGEINKDVSSPHDAVESASSVRSSKKHGNSHREYTTLFPENQADFDLHFVDYGERAPGKKRPDPKIKNKSRFQNRIVGLCSYYGNLYFGKDTQPGFPEELPLKVERVPMSSAQYAKYDEARDIEREEARSKGKGPSGEAERFASNNSSSSYRIRSRLLSNFLIPDYALGPSRGKKMPQKYIDKIKASDLKNLSKFSPKFDKIHG